MDHFGILPAFLKNFLESEIWSAVLRPGRKPHWVSLVQLFSGIFFKALGNVNVKLIENFQKASRSAQKAVAGHMRPAGRVFETLVYTNKDIFKQGFSVI